MQDNERISGKFKSELCRKGIHLLIALVPALAALNRSHTALLLMTGILFYTWAEGMRFLGFSMPFISSVTSAVLRKREKGNFASAPVTLGLGALLSLLVFPPPVAAVAIYALAFGDSVSSLVGQFLGRLRPGFLRGKSIEGFSACLVVSSAAGYFVFGEWKAALAAGFAAALTDALPLREFDNIALPLAAGLSALAFLS